MQRRGWNQLGRFLLFIGSHWLAEPRERFRYERLQTESTARGRGSSRSRRSFFGTRAITVTVVGPTRARDRQPRRPQCMSCEPPDPYMLNPLPFGQSLQIALSIQSRLPIWEVERLDFASGLHCKPVFSCDGGHGNAFRQGQPRDRHDECPAPRREPARRVSEPDASRPGTSGPTHGACAYGTADPADVKSCWG